MGYVIAGILVVLIIGGLIMFLVMNATKKSNVSDAGDPGADQNPMAMVGSDDATPAGDTDQHSDATGEEGSPPRPLRPRAPGRPQRRPAGRRRRSGGRAVRALTI